MTSNSCIHRHSLLKGAAAVILALAVVIFVLAQRDFREGITFRGLRG